MEKTMTLARDLMSRPVRQLTSWTPVGDAAAFLLRHGISGAPVLDEHGKWIGVFTQNDLARAVQSRLIRPEVRRSLETREPVVDVFALPPEELARTPVRSFMTLGLFTVFPDATVEEVVATMTKFHIHRVFVIDEQNGSLLGVITTMDVLRGMEEKQPARQRNRKIQQA
jgi:CBS domain-containing protein